MAGIAATEVEAPPAPDVDKLRIGWQVRAARAGIALDRLPDGKWLARKWNLCRELNDDAVESWLNTVGAPA